MSCNQVNFHIEWSGKPLLSQDFTEYLYSQFSAFDKAGLKFSTFFSLLPFPLLLKDNYTEDLKPQKRLWNVSM